jgi:glutathione S-transferase
MTLKLLGKTPSINVRKVLWLAHELRLALDHDPDPGAVTALNPNALVPVLIESDGESDGGGRDFVLWESNTICRYLCGREHAFDLLPAEPRARARVEQWVDWQATDLNTAWRHVFMARVRRHPAFPDDAGAEASAAEWNRLMTILDGQLARSGGHVAGSAFTLADIVLGLSAHRWRRTPMQRPPLPHVASWLDRLTDRPAFRLCTEGHD